MYSKGLMKHFELDFSEWYFQYIVRKIHKFL